MDRKDNRYAVQVGFVAVGHERGHTMAQPLSLPCVGVEFKLNPVAAESDQPANATA